MRSKVVTAILATSVAVGAMGGAAAAHEADVLGSDPQCRGALISVDAIGHRGLPNAAQFHQDQLDGDTPRDLVAGAKVTCFPPGNP